MARRKRNKQPNLPEATLRRAREQAELPPEEAAESAANEVEAEKPAPQPVTPAAPKLTGAASSSLSRQQRISAARLEQNRRRGEVAADVVEYLLEHPNKIVTEAQLREEYGHVLLDLRNMALLAAALIVVMVVVAQFI